MAATQAKSENCPGRPSGWIVGLTCLVMLAFAANSLLARMAFQNTAIDAASFTAIRIATGALTLWAITVWTGHQVRFSAGNGLSALLLFVYAAAFSFAYRHISTGAGALILFAFAQLTMIAYGLWRGERTGLLGVIMALGGLAAFLAPGASAPPWGAAMLMALSGVAWGGFSLLGRADDAPVATTASSFLMAVPLAIGLVLLNRNNVRIDQAGALYAVLSGSLASGVGYAVWYWVRVRMAAISAGTVQLSVPVLSAVLGLWIMGEHISIRSGLSALFVLAGVVWVMRSARRKR